jgi:hypothetical protein
MKTQNVANIAIVLFCAIAIVVALGTIIAPIREGIVVSRGLEAGVILADPTYTDDVKLQILSQMNLQDTKYTTILTNTGSAQEKVQKLVKQLALDGGIAVSKLVNILKMDTNNSNRIHKSNLPYPTRQNNRA